jgi:hypothetical protein
MVIVVLIFSDVKTGLSSTFILNEESGSCRSHFVVSVYLAASCCALAFLATDSDKYGMESIF